MNIIYNKQLEKKRKKEKKAGAAYLFKTMSLTQKKKMTERFVEFQFTI